ncbi:MAG: rRNA maturation RNase YbeY [Candidatus Paceibacterota bacterium]
MSTENTFSIINKTKGKLPRLPFAQMKDAVLGKKYTVSLVFIGKTTAKKLNFQYRKINKPTDILSFSLSKNEGEIFINPNKARAKAKEFGRKYDNYLAFLFIHGLYHLKGLDHGEDMEKAEAKTRRVFNI